MREKRITIMKLKVDLQCDKCYKKVKKVLSKFPQIRDQIYDENHDTVTIKVVCCSPEMVRDKLCCEGGGSIIKGIEIAELPKPKPPEPEKPKPPHPAPVEPEKPKLPPTAPTTEPTAVKFVEPVAPLSVIAYPSPAASAGLFYEGGLGGPWGFYRRPIYDSYGGSGPCYVGCHCQQHLYEEEEASACRIT